MFEVSRLEATAPKSFHSHVKLVKRGQCIDTEKQSAQHIQRIAHLAWNTLDPDAEITSDLNYPICPSGDNFLSFIGRVMSGSVTCGLLQASKSFANIFHTVQKATVKKQLRFRPCVLFENRYRSFGLVIDATSYIAKRFEIIKKRLHPTDYKRRLVFESFFCVAQTGKDRVEGSIQDESIRALLKAKKLFVPSVASDVTFPHLRDRKICGQDRKNAGDKCLKFVHQRADDCLTPSRALHWSVFENDDDEQHNQRNNNQRSAKLFHGNLRRSPNQTALFHNSRLLGSSDWLARAFAANVSPDAALSASGNGSGE